MRQTRNKAAAHWISDLHKHDRYRAGLASQCRQYRVAIRQDDVWCQVDQFRGKGRYAIGIDDPTILDPNIVAVRQSQILKLLLKCLGSGLAFRIVIGKSYHRPNTPHFVGLVRTRGKWPHRRRTPEKRDELAPLHVAPLRTRLVEYQIITGYDRAASEKWHRTDL